MKRIVQALSALALVLAASASHAEYVKVEFTGHATSAGFYGDAAANFPTTGAGSYLDASSLITGYFYYDLTTPSTYSGTNGLGGTYNTYVNATAGVGVKFSSNGFQFAPNDNSDDYKPRVDVDDVAGNVGSHDTIVIYGKENTAFGAAQDTTLQLFDKHSGGTLSSSALPTSLSGNDYSGLLTFYWTDNVNNRSFQFIAAIDTLNQVAAVPEPETYAMLLGGLALVGVIKRRASRRIAA